MAFKMKGFSGFKKKDDKDKMELESLMSPESRDTLASGHMTPGTVDYLLRAGMSHSDLVKLIKDYDKRKKQEKSEE